MKEYIGDSVYVNYQDNEFEDGLILTTENDGTASNLIFINSTVFENLIAYVNKIRTTHGAPPIILPKRFPK